MSLDYNKRRVEALLYFHKSEILPLLEKQINKMLQEKPVDPIAYIVINYY